MHRFLNIMLYAALLAGFLLYGWEELTLAAKKLVFWALTALPQLRRLPARVATWRESRRSLKVKVRILNEGKKENFISAAYTGMKRTLNTTGSQDKVRLIRLVSLCTGSAGAALAFSLGSWMLVPILSIGMGLLPMWLTRFRQYSYHLEITGELSVALSMVTNSYIRTENILLAVEENLPPWTGPAYLPAVSQKFQGRGPKHQAESFKDEPPNRQPRFPAVVPAPDYVPGRHQPKAFSKCCGKPIGPG